jgi:hypothetical protein
MLIWPCHSAIYPPHLRDFFDPRPYAAAVNHDISASFNNQRAAGCNGLPLAFLRGGGRGSKILDTYDICSPTTF